MIIIMLIAIIMMINNLRARPVVNLETELRFVTPVPGKIDLGSADCVTEKGDQVIIGIMIMISVLIENDCDADHHNDFWFQVTCTQLSLCLRYSGTGVADTLEVPYPIFCHDHQ